MGLFALIFNFLQLFLQVGREAPQVSSSHNLEATPIDVSSEACEHRIVRVCVYDVRVPV